MNRRIKSQVWKARKYNGKAAILYLGRSALVVANDYEVLKADFSLGGTMEVLDPEGEKITIAASKITSVRDTAGIEDEPEPDVYGDSAEADDEALAEDPAVVDVDPGTHV